jgi:hypothetical protein
LPENITPLPSGDYARERYSLPSDDNVVKNNTILALYCSRLLIRLL